MGWSCSLAPASRNAVRAGMDRCRFASRNRVLILLRARIRPRCAGVPRCGAHPSVALLVTWEPGVRGGGEGPVPGGLIVPLTHGAALRSGSADLQAFCMRRPRARPLTASAATGRSIAGAGGRLGVRAHPEWGRKNSSCPEQVSRPVDEQRHFRA